MSFSAIDKEKAKRSSRAAGAVGPNAKVPKIVRDYAHKHYKILDYGAGHTAHHANKLREEGYNVTAHDHHAIEGVHDPDALSREYDLVYASNVLNTQNSHRALLQTMKELHKSVKKGGTLIVNFPVDPRYDAYKGLTGRQAVAKLERLLNHHFEHVLPLPGQDSAPIYVIKNPRRK